MTNKSVRPDGDGHCSAEKDFSLTGFFRGYVCKPCGTEWPERQMKPECIKHCLARLIQPTRDGAERAGDHAAQAVAESDDRKKVIALADRIDARSAI